MMKNIAIVLCIALVHTISFSQDTPRQQYLKGFHDRVRYMTSTYDTSTAGGFYEIAARYAHNTDLAWADSMFIEVLRKPRGDMFWMFPCIGAYECGKDRMSEKTRAAVRHAWKTYEPYRGDTENHWAMYHASLFLAAEAWPNLPGPEWYNGMSSDENRKDAEGYLKHWMEITTTIGQGEFDSPDYFAEYANAMSLLASYAKDPEMKKRGTMMMDYILADFAAEHLDGQYLGGFSRIYQPAVYKPLLSTASGFAYLYFGTGEPTRSGWCTLAALGNYTLPQIIYNIATDRSSPYVERERKRVRNVIRFGTEKNPPVYKYTYVTADYGIGSLQGGLLQPIQQHTWGVRYLSGKPYTTIFGLHPYWSSYELGMFFPEEIKPLIADVVASKGTYNNPDKWTGGSPFERTFQHKNTLIVLYDIEPGTTTEHIDGFFPRNLEERIIDPSGWILCKAGVTYVGWYPLQPYEWIEEQDPSLSEDTSAVTGHWRLRSHMLQNGYVVEVRSQSEIGSFAAFSAAVRQHVPKSTLVPGRVSVEYTNLEGERMSFAFPEARSLNGITVDLTNTKLFDSPFLHAEVGSQKLTMTYKGTTRVLDFKRLTITE